tara:strand:- start:7383 stop:8711 length:1329 start_codon:yes stop_codon:yes gene_type:complete
MIRELFSLEAEYSVLGALMIDESLFDEITAKLHISDFYDMECAALYSAIIETRAAGEPIDAVTVGIRHPLLPSGAGILAFAGNIAKNVPSASNWSAYAGHVKERAILRRVVEVAEAVKESTVTHKPLAEIIANAQQAMADLRDLQADECDYKKLASVLPGVIDGIDAKFNDCALPKTSTGLADLDKLLGGGLRDKWMLVIAGRPGSGKTTIGLQIAQHATTRGGKVGLVFSLEMPEEELAMRSLASLGGVDLGRMDSGKMLDNDWPMLTNAVQQANEAELYICDKPGITVPQIRSICRQVQHKHGLDVVVIDYIGLIASAGKFGNRTEAVGAISTAIKNLSKELGVPVIVLAQLNRDVTKRKGGKPMASDLRDSGQIEQDADAVLLVHRDEETEEGRNGVTELILDKGRQMKKGSCLVQQQGNYARFVPFTGSRYDQGDDQW